MLNRLNVVGYPGDPLGALEAPVDNLVASLRFAPRWQPVLPSIQEDVIGDFSNVALAESWIQKGYETHIAKNFPGCAIPTAPIITA